jgi:DNA-binding response OmpR family regulator
MLTSSGEQRDIAESYKLGVNSYIQKPVDIGEFRKAIRALALYWLGCEPVAVFTNADEFPMSETVRVLIVEDDPVDADLMVRELKRGGFDPDWVRVQTESEYLAQLDREPDVILSDSNLPLFDGFEALDLLRKRALDIPFILVSGRMGEDLAVEAMKRGASDYLLKDRLARLGEAVRRAIDLRRLRAERIWAIGALRQSEERYRLVSEVSSDYVYSLRVDPDGALTYEWITDPFTRITGFDAAELNERGWTSLCHPEDQAIVRPASGVPAVRPVGTASIFASLPRISGCGGCASMTGRSFPNPEPRPGRCEPDLWRRAGYHRTKATRGTTSSIAKNGGDRTAGRRRRSRLQQSPYRDLRLWRPPDKTTGHECDRPRIRPRRSSKPPSGRPS